MYMYLRCMDINLIKLINIVFFLEIEDDFFIVIMHFDNDPDARL